MREGRLRGGEKCHGEGSLNYSSVILVDSMVAQFNGCLGRKDTVNLKSSGVHTGQLRSLPGVNK